MSNFRTQLGKFFRGILRRYLYTDEQKRRMREAILGGHDTDAAKVRLAAAALDMNYPGDPCCEVQRDLWAIADRIERGARGAMSEEVTEDVVPTTGAESR